MPKVHVLKLRMPKLRMPKAPPTEPAVRGRRAQSRACAIHAGGFSATQPSCFDASVHGTARCLPHLNN